MYFKTKKEVVEHLHRIWHDIGADDMYGRAAINDAITCICYGSDDLKDEENSASKQEVLYRKETEYGF